MTRRRTIVTAAILAGALGLTACGTNRSESGGSGGGSTCDTSKGTLVIGMVAPLSGSLSALGLGMRNSAKLAVDQANQKCTVKGYKLAFQPEDDQATAQIAGQAGTKLASDPNVVGVVGTLNPTYFRTATTDLVQGPFGAQYLVQKAGKKNVAVIDDGKTYGAGLADQAAQEITKLGGKVVAREKVGEKDTDFAGVIGKIRPSNPDAVYYGGEFPVAGPLSKQLAGAGLNIPLMGGDGIVDAKFVQLGGKEGDLATSVGAPAENLPSAKQFTDDYKAAGFSEPFSAYGVLTYDSTNVIIGGLAKAIGDGGTFDDSKRQALIDAVQSTKIDGASGPVAFDQYGDTTNKVLTVYQVKGTDFAPIETGAYQAS
jgi:branched-chain amino acid transport system substrate-binding protein